MTELLQRGIVTAFATGVSRLVHHFAIVLGVGPGGITFGEVGQLGLMAWPRAVCGFARRDGRRGGRLLPSETKGRIRQGRPQYGSSALEIVQA